MTLETTGGFNPQHSQPGGFQQAPQLPYQQSSRGQGLLRAFQANFGQEPGCRLPSIRGKSHWKPGTFYRVELRDSLDINDSDAGTNWKNHHMDELDNNLGDSCARVSIFKKESSHRHSTTVPKTSYSCNRMSKRKAIPVTHGPLAALPALFEMFQDFWICDALGHIGPSTVSPCHTKKLWQIAAQADGMDGPNPFLPNDLPHDLPQLLGIRCSACTAEILQGLELSSPQKDA